MQATNAPIMETPIGPALNLTGNPDGAWPRRAHLSIRQDDSCSDPFEDHENQFCLTSWHPRHGGQHNLREPPVLDPTDEEHDADFVEMLKNGTAWLLDLYEHGGHRWDIRGEGPSCQWDTSRCAGILTWNGKPTDLGSVDTPEARKEQARKALEEYNRWANGECYGYVLTDADTGADLDSCYGFIGLGYLCEEVKRIAKGWNYTLVDKDGDEVAVEDVDVTYR